MTYYLVKSASEVTPILWDGVSAYTPPEGWQLLDEVQFVAWRELNPAPPTPVPVPESASPAYLRVALRRLHGITSPMILAKIELIPDPQDRQDADDLWEYATQIRRTHPLVVSLAASFALTEAEVDQVFILAEQLAA
jgi:hypothetical protein